MPGVLDGLRRKFARAEQPRCDNCAFVEFFRSNGDGQVRASKRSAAAPTARSRIALCPTPATASATNAPLLLSRSQLWAIRR